MSNFPTILGVTMPHYGGIGVVNQKRKHYPRPSLPPASCCIYPWPDPHNASPLYPATDLPDSVTLYDGAQTFTAPRQHYSYFVYDNVFGFWIALTSMNGSVWELSTSPTQGGSDHAGDPGFVYDDTLVTDWGVMYSPPATSECLKYDGVISTEGFGDQFHSAYSVAYSGPTTTVNRIDLCTWTGTASNGDHIRIHYTLNAIMFMGHKKPAWVLNINSTGVFKSGLQNKPDGTYGAATVS